MRKYRVYALFRLKNNDYHILYCDWHDDYDEIYQQKEEFTLKLEEYFKRGENQSITFYPEDDKNVVYHFVPSEIRSVEVRVDSQDDFRV